jgi:Fe2+ transport system protein FeoA
MNIMSLDQAPRDIAQEIVEIASGEEAKRKLLAMGVHVGDAIVKLNSARGCPMLIRNVTTRSSKIAIARGLARKILVRDARP